jgi:hypothetical protein
MSDTVPRKPIASQVRKAARNHAQAMMQLHKDTQRVAVTAAKLTEILERGRYYGAGTGPLYSKVDKAMGKLGDAYAELAAAFDNLEE